VRRVEQWRANLELVARLEKVRLVRPSVKEKERFDDEDVAETPTLESKARRK